ncbi:P-loop NTPase fold protein [Nonomuraea sp. NPDC050404]|uniref:P-loop NTPase fold protein n=1 Tax=Nonomuraea sp. NPDC050404 TaxID=3155783 RepID=UPI0033EEF2DD
MSLGAGLVPAAIPAQARSSHAGAAAAPEFRDEDQLSIALERLRTGAWPVVVVNPGPAIDVEVQVAGPIADAIALKGGSRAHIPAGGSATFTVVGSNSRPHAGSGQLVLVSEAGIDRLRVAVTTQPSFLTRHPFVPVVVGVLLLVSIVAAPLSWWRRRRGRSREMGEATAPRTRAPAGPQGFTHSDEPVYVDELNRAAYVRQLAALAREATPPMVIGVFGEWGTGKTSMLMQVREQLARDPDKYAHVWFDPWRHQHEDNPVLPLLHAIVDGLGLQGRENVRRTLRTISDMLGSLVLSTTLRISLPDVRKSIEDYDAEHFRIRSERTRLDEYLRVLIETALAVRGQERLIVFVDDLDRCEADRITGLLESLKLHFNRDNCVFVLGVAKGPLIAAVREKYKEDPVGDYLDKIIQFPFEMPRMSEEDFASYLERLLADKDIEAAGGMLKCALPRNPRTIKRFINVLILQDRVAKETAHGLYDVSILAAVLLLRDRAPETYAQLMKEPSLLRRLAEMPETPADYGETVAGIVDELRRDPRRVPRDAEVYIDLVRKSPQSSDPWLSGQEESSHEIPLDGLAGLVHERVDREVGDDGPLMDPVVRFSGEDPPRVRGLDDILGLRTGKLLLTGGPGTGKSVLAARLARRLSERRGGHVPVFLPFAGLEVEQSAYERALMHALVAEYGLSLAGANAMLVRRRLILVLDGLETLARDAREEFLGWAEHTEFDVIMTGRTPSAPGFEALEVLGVVASEARRRLETLLAARKVEPDRLLGLTSELLGSPALLAVLTGAPEWIDDLPPEPVSFVPWYAERALAATAAAGLDAGEVTDGLCAIAAETIRRRQDTFRGDDPDIRTTLRQARVRAKDVSPLLTAAARAGLLRQCEPRAYHFLHPLLRRHLAERH